MKTYTHQIIAITLLACYVTAASSATYITSKVNGDDQFKIYLSPVVPGVVPFQPEGLQYANGLGWGSCFTNTLWLPQDSTGANYKDYYLNIWVQDVGGGGPDLLGQFILSAAPGAGTPAFGSIAGCKFDNNKIKIETNAQFWKVTKPLSLSSATAPTGYPAWVSNYLPPWVQPTLTPDDLGPNGIGPWGLRACYGAVTLANPAPHWITTPPSLPNNLTEAWFSTHIRCP